MAATQERVIIGGPHGRSLRADYHAQLSPDQRVYRPQVKIIGFGGTIAMAPGEDGVLRPAKSVNELVEQVPALSTMATVRLEQVVNKDSTNITPTDWRVLASKIVDAQNSRAGGVLVTHGTDTMAYTAAAVAFALGRGLTIPVVFTGSQLPMGTAGTDARFNLENAMRTLVAAREKGIAEVMIAFSNRVLRGVRAIKVSEAGFDAFDSPGVPHLGSISATGINLQDHAFREEDSTRLHVRSNFSRNILTVDVIPGQNPAFLRHILTSGKFRGILLRALGAGNIPSEGASSLLPFIKDANKKNIPVVVSTKFPGGTTHMELYDPGKRAYDLGAIPTGTMTDVAAQVKLMWLLGNTHAYYGRVDLGRLREQMATNYVGEITSK